MGVETFGEAFSKASLGAGECHPPVGALFKRQRLDKRGSVDVARSDRFGVQAGSDPRAGNCSEPG